MRKKTLICYYSPAPARILQRVEEIKEPVEDFVYYTRGESLQLQYSHLPACSQDLFFDWVKNSDSGEAGYLIHTADGSAIQDVLVRDFSRAHDNNDKILADSEILQDEVFTSCQS